MRAEEYLESSNGLFKLYFLRLGAFRGQYLIINHQSRSVWIANQNNPRSNTSEVTLTVTQDGDVVITDDNTSFVVNSERSPQPPSNHIRTNSSLKLLDTGNLVFLDGDQILWQSFDYPSNSDTLVPGMKLGQFRTISGRLQIGFLASRLSASALRAGAFTFGVDPNNTKQLVVLQRGELYWCSGMWNGHNSFPFVLNFFEEIDFSYTFNDNANESYFTFTINTENVSVGISLESNGVITNTVSSIVEKRDVTTQINCDSTEDVSSYDTEGCTSREPSKCGSYVFKEKQSGMSDWWTNNSDIDLNHGLSDCKAICLEDCSCTAFATARIDGTGCKFSKSQYQERDSPHYEVFYLRISAPEIVDPPSTQPTPAELPTPRKHPIVRHLWLGFIIGGSTLCSILLIVIITFRYTQS